MHADGLRRPWAKVGELSRQVQSLSDEGHTEASDTCLLILPNSSKPRSGGAFFLSGCRLFSKAALKAWGVSTERATPPAARRRAFPPARDVLSEIQMRVGASGVSRSKP